MNLSGMYGHGAGMYNHSDSRPKLTNVQITGNKAVQGGGMYNFGSYPTVTNVTIASNLVTTKDKQSGAGIMNVSGSQVIAQNTIIIGNGFGHGFRDNQFVDEEDNIHPDDSVQLQNSHTATGTLGNSIIMGSYFVSHISVENAPTDRGNYRPNPTSLTMIDTGNNGYIGHKATDLAGQPRIKLGAVDLGAYEYQGSTNANLSDLAVDGTTVDSFDPNVTLYKLNVSSTMKTVTVTATAADNNAEIEVGTGAVYTPVASGDESDPITLKSGVNKLNVRVTAQDGVTVKVYQLEITRASSGSPGGGSPGGGSPGGGTPGGGTPGGGTPGGGNGGGGHGGGSDTVPAPSDAPSPAFTDIANHWGGPHIVAAAGNNLISGYPDGTFRPDAPITRAEFTVMLVNALQLNGTGAAVSFADWDKVGMWAQQAIKLAVQAGIVSGYEDGTFRPGAHITRAEMAVMIARALHVGDAQPTSTGFADDGQIPQWAKAAVAALHELGVVSGRGGNNFAPNDIATRAEAVVMLLRMSDFQLAP